MTLFLCLVGASPHRTVFEFACVHSSSVIPGELEQSESEGVHSGSVCTTQKVSPPGRPHAVATDPSPRMARLARDDTCEQDALLHSAGARRLKRKGWRGTSQRRAVHVCRSLQSGRIGMRGIPRPAIFGCCNRSSTRLLRDARWSALRDQGSSGPSASGVVASDRTAFALHADRWAARQQTPIPTRRAGRSGPPPGEWDGADIGIFTDAAIDELLFTEQIFRLASARVR